MKTAEAAADRVFLKAFDAAIQQVHEQLASSGLNEAAIWGAFRRATAVLAEFSSDVDNEQAPRMTRSHQL